MISRKSNILFVHIPKTAGQSIEQFFMDREGLDWDNYGHRKQFLMYRNQDQSRGTERLAHLSAAEYVDCGYIDQSEFEQLFKFSFVRNPWERILSEYRYRNYVHHRSFRQFILKRLPKPGWDDQYRHVMPQYDMLYKDGRLLVDFVGRFENLQQDFDKICETLSIEESELPFRNRSAKVSRNMRRKLRNWVFLNGENGKRTLAEYYDADTRDAVAEIYARDIETFGYEFPS